MRFALKGNMVGGADPVKRIHELEHRLADLDAERSRIAAELTALRCTTAHLEPTPAPVTNDSPPQDKIALISSSSPGRENVYALRWESAQTGKAGYQPACRNEWVRGLCGRPRMKCADCLHREFLPLTDEVIRNHVSVAGQGSGRVVGIYPLLPDESPSRRSTAP